MALPVSGSLLAYSSSHPTETRGELDLLIRLVKAELVGKLCLSVPSRLASYYENEDILSSQASASVPESKREIQLAGSCLATGSSTACVFHAMRSAEIGVRILGGVLGVTFPDKPIELAEWQQIPDQADSKIKAIGQQPKSPQRDEDQTFYSMAAAQFRYFKVCASRITRSSIRFPLAAF
jgi:hypothetical protein